MAEFEVNCPHCGEKLTVQEEWAGMNGECPSCKKSFAITLKTRKLPDPRKKSTGNCNLVIDNYETEKRWKFIEAIRNRIWHAINTDNFFRTVVFFESKFTL